MTSKACIEKQKSVLLNFRRVFHTDSNMYKLKVPNVQQFQYVGTEHFIKLRSLWPLTTLINKRTEFQRQEVADLTSDARTLLGQ